MKISDKKTSHRITKFYRAEITEARIFKTAGYGEKWEIAYYTGSVGGTYNDERSTTKAEHHAFRFTLERII